MAAELIQSLDEQATEDVESAWAEEISNVSQTSMLASSRQSLGRKQSDAFSPSRTADLKLLELLPMTSRRLRKLRHGTRSRILA